MESDTCQQECKMVFYIGKMIVIKLNDIKSVGKMEKEMKLIQYRWSS